MFIPLKCVVMSALIWDANAGGQLSSFGSCSIQGDHEDHWPKAGVPDEC